MSDNIGKVVEEVLSCSDDEQLIIIQEHTEEQTPEQLALILESLPPAERITFWGQIPLEQRLDVLVEMRLDPRKVIIDSLETDELHQLFDDVDADTLLEMDVSLPDSIIDQALERMDTAQKSYYEAAQKYQDNQVGHWANHAMIALPSKTPVKVARRLLRRSMPPLTEVVYVATTRGKWLGCVSVASIYQADDYTPLGKLKIEDYPKVSAEQDVQEAADFAVQSGFAAIPVVTEEGLLLGRMDLYTAIDVMKEASESQLMATAGLNEDEDLFGPVRRSAQSRALWLGINLLTAFLASWFIGLFEGTIEQVVALAVLMPVVASMGGIAGSQTLTLIIRGLALGQITKANFKALLTKELKVGALNGVLWAIVIGIVAHYWFGSAMLGVVIALAIVTNIAAAAISGVVIPVILDKLKLDPALSGSVILTTVTDVVGFVAFLGLGTLFLL